MTKQESHDFRRGSIKDSVHFLENGVVYVLFYQCILELM